MKSRLSNRRRYKWFKTHVFAIFKITPVTAIARTLGLIVVLQRVAVLLAHLAVATARSVLLHDDGDRLDLRVVKV